MNDIKIGYAITGSFCTFKQAFEGIKALTDREYSVTPIMSFNAYNISSRFGSCYENRDIVKFITGNEIIHTIEDAEPIGPGAMFDVLVVAPCTSNTLAKLAIGVNDTPVTMAVKSHLRNSRPVVIALSTNDALASSAKNIGTLQNYRNYYFCPYRQDNVKQKPMSMVADFALLPDTLEAALGGVQIQPMVR